MTLPDAEAFKAGAKDDDLLAALFCSAYWAFSSPVILELSEEVGVSQPLIGRYRHTIEGLLA